MTRQLDHKVEKRIAGKGGEGHPVILFVKMIDQTTASRSLRQETLGLTVTEAPKALGVSRKTLSSILNGHTGILPEMGLRLSIAFDITPDGWLNQRVPYNRWNAEQCR